MSKCVDLDRYKKLNDYKRLPKDGLKTTEHEPCEVPSHNIEESRIGSSIVSVRTGSFLMALASLMNAMDCVRSSSIYLSLIISLYISASVRFRN